MGKNRKTDAHQTHPSGEKTEKKNTQGIENELVNQQRGKKKTLLLVGTNDVTRRS